MTKKEEVSIWRFGFGIAVTLFFAGVVNLDFVVQAIALLVSTISTLGLGGAFQKKAEKCGWKQSVTKLQRWRIFDPVSR